MHRIQAAALALALAAAPGVAAARGGRAASGVDGLWLNPRGSVAVRTGPCADRLCGWVVWASPKAQNDAREGGLARLIGTELLQDYRPAGAGSWSGTVYVPDMGRHFSSEINAMSPTALQVKGCILAGLICKSQIWTRIARLPQ